MEFKIIQRSVPRWARSGALRHGAGRGAGAGTALPSHRSGRPSDFSVKAPRPARRAAGVRGADPGGSRRAAGPTFPRGEDSAGPRSAAARVGHLLGSARPGAVLACPAPQTRPGARSHPALLAPTCGGAGEGGGGGSSSSCSVPSARGLRCGAGGRSLS